jgi:anti-sigma B factor antagonist
MENRYHGSPEVRERVISRYLARTLTTAAAQEFEDHYLSCDDCYEHLRAAELLISDLARPAVEGVRAGDVTVIRFTGSVELTFASADLRALMHMVDERADTKVLIDLQKVSRIDSTGLGMLMQCYTHSVRKSGALKLLQPGPAVKRVLSLTKIDAVVPTFDDEATALGSFR